MLMYMCSEWLGSLEHACFAHTGPLMATHHSMSFLLQSTTLCCLWLKVLWTRPIRKNLWCVGRIIWKTAPSPLCACISFMHSTHKHAQLPTLGPVISGLILSTRVMQGRNVSSVLGFGYTLSSGWHLCSVIANSRVVLPLHGSTISWMDRRTMSTFVIISG